MKLTHSKGGWLKYLNTQVKVSNGGGSVKWCWKPSSKSILIHATSDHAAAIRRSVTQLCTDDEKRQKSLRLASVVAKENSFTV